MQTSDRNKGEQDFIDEYTRHLMATKWGPECLRKGEIDFDDADEEFVEYARSRKWLAKSSDALTSRGYKTAAAYYRR